MNPNTLEDLVNVPVPRRHLAPVYELIARLEMGEAAAPDTVELAEPSANGSETDWSDELVRRMYSESPPAMKRVLKVLAGRPDEVVASDELVREALGEGAGWPNLAGTLGAFGNRVANRYGRTTWPFAPRWNHELGRMTYVMPRRVAEIIAAL